MGLARIEKRRGAAFPAQAGGAPGPVNDRPDGSFPRKRAEPQQFERNSYPNVECLGYWVMITHSHFATKIVTIVSTDNCCLRKQVG